MSRSSQARSDDIRRPRGSIRGCAANVSRSGGTDPLQFELSAYERSPQSKAVQPVCLACCRDGGRKRRDHLQRDWVSGEVTAISFNWFSRRQIRPEIAAEPRQALRTKSPTPALTLRNAC